MIASLSLVTGLASSFPSRLRSLGKGGRFEPVEIPASVVTRTRVASVLSTLVDGAQVRFASPDMALKPSAEAMGCALLLPALHAGRGLTIHPKVCAVWAEQFASIPLVVEGWWQYSPVDLDLVLDQQSPRQRCNATALAFSCGVDSFYSLLKYPHPLEALVGVVGFDVKLSDRSRADSLTASIRTVAAEHAMQSIVVSTNLRQHRLLKGAPWERTHGGALAAIGHLLSDAFGTFVISSSVARTFIHPWGSHWQLDPKFGSAAMIIEHFGDDKMRSIKLMEIAPEPIVRSHLRVCWEYRNRGTNCGTCEKCVRTMLTLDVCGQLGHFTSICNTHRLADSIAKCPFVPRVAIDSYEWFQQLGVSHKYQAPVRSLIERSKAHYYGHA